jgi:hypothetical protein
LTLVRAGADLTLYRVPGPIHDVRPSSVRVVIVVGGDVLALTLVVAAAGAVLLGERRRLVRYRAVA